MKTEEKEEIKSRKVCHHGHAVKRLRQEQRLSQKELAAIIGLSPQALSRYETQDILNEDIVNQIAKGLNVSEDLIKEMEDAKPLTFYIENNTFLGNATMYDQSNSKSIVYQTSEEQNTFLEELRKNSEEMRKQYENILTAYKQLLETCQQRIRELEK